MALATTIKFGIFSLLIGDGQSPEVFTAPCGITSLNKTTNVDAQTTMIPDCSDPDIVTWLAVDEISRQLVISGSGTLNQESLDMWCDWDEAGGYKNVRFYRNLLAANHGGYLQGPALLTQWEETAEAKRRWQFNFQVTFDGKPAFTPAS